MTQSPAEEITPEIVAGLASLASRSDFPKLERQLRNTGYCSHPIPLRGTVEACDALGQRRVWSARSEPDGVLRKAWGNRREAICPACAERYRQDAYHLIAAGLRGGK